MSLTLCTVRPTSTLPIARVCPLTSFLSSWSLKDWSNFTEEWPQCGIFRRPKRLFDAWGFFWAPTPSARTSKWLTAYGMPSPRTICRHISHKKWQKSKICRGCSRTSYNLANSWGGSRWLPLSTTPVTMFNCWITSLKLCISHSRLTRPPVRLFRTFVISEWCAITINICIPCRPLRSEYCKRGNDAVSTPFMKTQKNAAKACNSTPVT